MNLADVIARVFTEPERSTAAEQLDTYDGSERERVQLAVLALAGGDLAKLRDLVEAAKRDYRDILYWAEYPEESKSMTREDAAARYRALGVRLPTTLEDKPRRRKRR